jgi:DNA-binding transcriptional regulator YiaG
MLNFYDKMYAVKPTRKTRRQAYTEQLSGRIETIRVGMGLEPKDMAKRLKLPFETYRSYEEGRRCMPPYLLADLIRISGHGPWFVLTGEPENKAPHQGVETGELQPELV